MAKKYDFEFIKQYFADNNCVLLANEYKDCYTSMSYICECKNKSKISFNSFKSGGRCKKCGIKKSAEKQKFTLDYVRQYFKDKNCVLLATEYKNDCTIMSYICQCGNQSKISFNNFKNGRRCKKCKDKKLANIFKHTFEYVKQYFKDRNCTLLAEEYVNNWTSMPHICMCGNQSTICFSDFQQGGRCSKCAGNEKHTLDYVRRYFKDRNCMLLAKEYINTITEMPYICECGNESKISFNRFQSGVRCKECGYKKQARKGETHHSYNPDRDYVELRNKISDLCGALVRRTLKTTGKTKNNKSEFLLGYSRDELLNHLISLDYNFKLKRDEYHVDHKFPVKAFVEHNILDIKIINALDNLQPLLAKENISKGDKYDKNEFFLYLKNKWGINLYETFSI